VITPLDSELEWGCRPRPAASHYTATLAGRKLRYRCYWGKQGPWFLDGGTSPWPPCRAATAMKNEQRPKLPDIFYGVAERWPCYEADVDGRAAVVDGSTDPCRSDPHVVAVHALALYEPSAATARCHSAETDSLIRSSLLGFCQTSAGFLATEHITLLLLLLFLVPSVVKIPRVKS